MTFPRVVVVSTLAAQIVACQRAPAPTTTTHVVNLAMNGSTLGEERATITIEGQRETAQMETSLSGPPLLRLRGRIIIDRGRPVLLRVTGDSPPSLPSQVDVSSTPDRSDTFLLRSPFPVHVLAMLVRRSMVGARRAFRVLPEGRVEVGSCEGISGPYPDATCHAVSGLPSGPVLIWLDERQALAAAAVQTPFGIVIATVPERDDSRPALAERFDVYSARP